MATLFDQGLPFLCSWDCIYLRRSGEKLERRGEVRRIAKRHSAELGVEVMTYICAVRKEGCDKVAVYILPFHCIRSCRCECTVRVHECNKYE